MNASRVGRERRLAIPRRSPRFARGPSPGGSRRNAVLRAFLADAFGVPQRNVTLLRGESGRKKLVRIEAPTRRPDRQWG